MSDVTITLPDEVLELIAQRAAELVAAQANQGSPWMTRAQAAAYLSLPLSRLEKDRTIPCHRDAGRVLYFKPELDAHFLGLGRT